MLTKEVLPPRQSSPRDLRNLRDLRMSRGARGRARLLLASVVLGVVVQVVARLLELCS